MTQNVRVTLAYPYTTKAGANHKADSTVSLPLEEAKNLLHNGRARTPDAAPAKKEPEAKKAAAPRKKAAKKASPAPATPAASSTPEADQATAQKEG